MFCDLLLSTSASTGFFCLYDAHWLKSLGVLLQCVCFGGRGDGLLGSVLLFFML